MTAAIIFNITLLGFFKYANFAVVNINLLLTAMGLGTITLQQVHLPIGISFFTFHTMSYLIDIYRGVVKVQKRPIDFALYVSLFPQLVAGPIIRYHDVADQISDRSMTVDGFIYGMKRFVIGLGKKVLIANTLAMTADQVFSLQSGSISTGLAWLGIVCYTLQIYFDFSGYSDMAIGLGRMFGFRFLENFNYPYISKSIREFWRRWHISLSNWFRDYLYIPLGGNRRSQVRTYFNLVTVFFLCGLWHGAKWNFVIWGLIHGFFLVLERTKFGALLDRTWSPVKHLYSLTVIAVGWVFFRSETLSGALNFLAVMGGFKGGQELRYGVAMYLNNEVLLVLLAAGLCSLPLRAMAEKVGDRFSMARGNKVLRYAFHISAGGALSFVFIISVMSLVSGTYNPFIYFRF